jgi:hypothetical protein
MSIRLSTGVKQPIEVSYGLFAVLPQGGTLDGLTQITLTRRTVNLWAENELPPGSGNFDWTSMDGFVQAAQEINCDLVLVLKTGHPEGVVDDVCYAAAIGNIDEDQPNRSCMIKPAYEAGFKNWISNIIRRYTPGDALAMPGLSASLRVSLEIENEAASSAFWNPHQVGDGVSAAADYIRLLELAYAAKTALDSSMEIILAGLEQLDQVQRCTLDPTSLPPCSGTGIKRRVEFATAVLARPDIFDAFDIHIFDFYRLMPNSIFHTIAYLRARMDEHGYTKPIYVLEWTSGYMGNIRRRDAGEAFGAYFPYSSDFDSVPYIEYPPTIVADDGSGPWDAAFGGTFTGGLSPTTGLPRIYAVAVRPENIPFYPDRFYWTDDYQGDGADGGLTAWQGPLPMESERGGTPLSYGVFVIWNTNEDHNANDPLTLRFAIGTHAFPAGAGEANIAAIAAAYSNLNYDPQGAHPEYVTYSLWFDAENARQHIKDLVTMLSLGVTKIIHVQFHEWFPGYFWDVAWWKWQGFIRYTGGTVEDPIFLRLPRFYAHQQFEQRVAGYTALAGFSLGAGISCYKFTSAAGVPTWIAWSRPEGAPQWGEYSAGDSVTVPVFDVAVADLLGLDSVTAIEVPVALDGSDDPIIPTSIVLPGQTLPIGDTPVYLIETPAA